MRAFIRQLRPAVLAIVIATVGLGIVYPLVTTAIGQVAFNDAANGSLIERDGEVVGSSLVGQPFVDDAYFHPRPSAASYEEGTSGGSNLGPTSDALRDVVTERVAAYRFANELDDAVPVPVDAVTASASGLDPHISLANARLQVDRVAAERGLTAEVVEALVADNVDDRSFGVLGEPGVNVVELNLALDALLGD